MTSQELQLPFIKLAATEIVSGVSGESEEKLRDIFNDAMVSYRVAFNLLALSSTEWFVEFSNRRAMLFVSVLIASALC